MSSLDFITKQTYIYGGITIITTGLIGHILNLCIFFSLRTFRENSSSIYLIFMSILNIIQLCITVLSRTMTGIYGSDGTNLSIVWCKFRQFLSHFSQILSLTCFCLVTIDQYCATSPYQHFRKFCQIKIAQFLVLLFASIWFIHAIPYLIFFDLTVSNTGQTSCVMTNSTYTQYRTYAILLLFVGFFPIVITMIFGSMAFYNVQNISYYTVPLVRREFDKQITAMVLVQVIINFFILLPNTVINVLILNINVFSDLNIQAQIRFSNNIGIMIYYLHLCVSKYFRYDIDI